MKYLPYAVETIVCSGFAVTGHMWLYLIITIAGFAIYESIRNYLP